jgi:NADPH2:quinone reductase
MRAVVVERFGGPEVLRLSDRDVGQPGAGQLLVDVGAPV